MDGLNREINDFDLIIKNGTLVDGQDLSQNQVT